MTVDPYSQPPEWVADLLGAVLMAHGRGIDAADAAWDFLRATGAVYHVESRVLHDRPSDRSRAVLVIDAAKNSSA